MTKIASPYRDGFILIYEIFTLAFQNIQKVFTGMAVTLLLAWLNSRHLTQKLGIRIWIDRMNGISCKFCRYLSSWELELPCILDVKILNSSLSYRYGCNL